MSVRIPPSELVSLGLLFEINRSTLHELGLEMQIDGSTGELQVIDYRPLSAAGVVYTPEQLRAGFAALDDTQTANAARLLKRWRLYGFMDQRLPEAQR